MTESWNYRVNAMRDLDDEIKEAYGYDDKECPVCDRNSSGCACDES